MQDRYFGDIGDFAKFGLLRALVRDDPLLRLGVHWYRVPDENSNNDGRHIEYLDSTRPDNVLYKNCDQELYNILGKLVSSGQRRLSLVREHTILPCTTAYFDSVLSYRKVSGNDRPEFRKQWLDSSINAMTDTDLVFFDPDNGLEVGVDRHRAKGPKYTFYDDLNWFGKSGKSIVIYQHACRVDKFCDQIRMRLKDLRKKLPKTKYEFLALRFRRVSPRAFLFAISKSHTYLLQQRICTFIQSPWRNHFEEIYL